MTVTFTEQDVAREVLRLAAAYPQGHYNPPPLLPDREVNCFYTRGEVDNGPIGICGCLFGQALRNLSHNDQALLEILAHIDAHDDGKSINDLLKEDLGMLLHTDLCNRWENTLTAALNSVQMHQDRGHEWSKAVQPLQVYLATHPLPETPPE